MSEHDTFVFTWFSKLIFPYLKLDLKCRYDVLTLLLYGMVILIYPSKFLSRRPRSQKVLKNNKKKNLNLISWVILGVKRKRKSNN